MRSALRTAAVGVMIIATAGSLAGCGGSDGSPTATSGGPTPSAPSPTTVVATPVPDLIGLTLDEALDAMEDATGGRPTVMGDFNGVVVSQSPDPGEPLPPDGAMGIEFSG